MCLIYSLPWGSYCSLDIESFRPFKTGLILKSINFDSCFFSSTLFQALFTLIDQLICFECWMKSHFMIWHSIYLFLCWWGCWLVLVLCYQKWCCHQYLTLISVGQQCSFMIKEFGEVGYSSSKKHSGITRKRKKTQQNKRKKKTLRFLNPYTWRVLILVIHG